MKGVVLTTIRGDQGVTRRGRAQAFMFHLFGIELGRVGCKHKRYAGFVIYHHVLFRGTVKDGNLKVYKGQRLGLGLGIEFRVRVRFGRVQYRSRFQRS